MKLREALNEAKKKKPGLWANIWAKRKRGERPAKPGEKGYPKTLDIDEMEEAEYQGRDVELNKPMQGDVAKFKVYVKDKKTGNVKKVNFGAKGERIKKDNPARRKSFRARHKCDTAKDKTTARYWSCKKW